MEGSNGIEQKPGGVYARSERGKLEARWLCMLTGPRDPVFDNSIVEVLLPGSRCAVPSRLCPGYAQIEVNAETRSDKHERAWARQAPYESCPSWC